MEVSQLYVELIYPTGNPQLPIGAIIAAMAFPAAGRDHPPAARQP